MRPTPHPPRQKASFRLHAGDPAWSSHGMLASVPLADAEGTQALTLYFSASCTMRSMSSFDRRPLSLVIVILFLVPTSAVSRRGSALEEQ
jgi:hypothetical protein